jgi:4'-phosphopantetheinyl transferase
LLALTYGAAGKPLLSPPPELAFNVSHSAGLVLIALTRRGTIGVDLESLTQNRILPEEMLQIAQDTFTPSIAAELASLPDGPEWVQAFYRAWTIREAVAKSDGRGIASPLKYYQFQTDQPNEVRVVLEPETPLGPASLAAEYLVHTFQLGIQASMAVALSQPEQKIELFDAANLLG